VHPLDRAEHPSRPQRRQGAGDQHDDAEEQRDAGKDLAPGAAERAFEKADIEHADAFAAAADQRFIGRDIPVANDEGAVEPGLAVAKHGAVYGVGNPGADGTLAGKQADIGGHPHVAEEERGGAGAVEGQGALGIDDGVQAVDEIEVLVEQDAAFEDADDPAGAVADRCGTVDHQAPVFAGAVVGAGVGGGDQRRLRALRQFRRERRQFFRGEKLGAGQRAAGERRGNRRARRFFAIFTVDRDQVQKIEALLAPDRQQQFADRPVAGARAEA